MKNYNESLKKVLIVSLIGIIIYLIFNLLSPKFKKIEYEENIELINRIEFQIVSNSIESKVLPTNYLIGYSYYSLFDDKKNILDIKAKVKNSSTKSIKIEDIFKKAKILLDKKTYPVAILFEEQRGKEFIDSTDTAIEPKQELICHFVLGIDDNKITNGENPILRINTKNEKFEYQMHVKILNEEIKNEKAIINLNYKGKNIENNELVKIPNFCEFKIQNVNYKDKIEPTNKSGKYEYYIASQGKKYLDLQVLVKNTSDREMLLEDMLGYATLMDNENNKICNLTKIVEENNGTKLNNKTEIYKILANQENTYHLIAELPLNTINSGIEMSINLFINGENYIYRINM